MASPAQVYEIYRRLAKDAAAIRDAQVAAGEAVSGTVNLLLSGDRGKLLSRWADEMDELCGVLDGSHADPYLMEATQTFYWASLYAASAGTTWAALGFEANRRLAPVARIDEIITLRAQVQRLRDLGLAAKPEKLFLLWCVADYLYRRQTPSDQQWSLEQLMDADVADMRKRSYLGPILRDVLGS